MKEIKWPVSNVSKCFKGVQTNKFGLHCFVVFRILAEKIYRFVTILLELIHYFVSFKEYKKVVKDSIQRWSCLDDGASCCKHFAP